MRPTKNVDVSDGIDGNVDDDADAFFWNCDDYEYDAFFIVGSVYKIICILHLVEVGAYFLELCVVFSHHHQHPKHSQTVFLGGGGGGGGG